MTCTRVETCPLFAQLRMKSSLKFWQTYYCEGDFARCERYRLAMSGQKVPQTLLPNGKQLLVPLDQLEPHHLS